MLPLVNGEEHRFARVRIITRRGMRELNVDEVTFNSRTMQGVLVLPVAPRERRKAWSVISWVQSSFELVATFGESPRIAREPRFLECRLVPRASPNIFFSFEGIVGFTTIT